MSHRDVLFTGSIGLENEEEVFRSLSNTIGERAKRYPDGETGERHYWVRWLDKVYKTNQQFQISDPDKKLAGYRDTQTRIFYSLADGVRGRDIKIDRFGYAKHAIASYKTFKTLKNAGVVPISTRFQVSLPTSVAAMTGFIDITSRAKIETTVENAIKGEVEDITSRIPVEELSIQWDICFEVVAHDGGGLPLHYEDIFSDSIDRICRHLDWVPKDAEVGIHLCYGDPGHQHILEPENLETCVSFANALSDGTSRSLNWIHMPVPRERNDQDYFKPLRHLNLDPKTELFLGLIHYTDGVKGTQKRVQTAEKFVSKFGVATECGFGRRPRETIPTLLEIHAKVADSY